MPGSVCTAQDQSEGYDQPQSTSNANGLPGALLICTKCLHCNCDRRVAAGLSAAFFVFPSVRAVCNGRRDRLSLFSARRYGKDPRKGVDKAWSTGQDKLLDIVGPLTRIFDMAESARLDQVAIDPEELSL
ncbi:hypothetical protein NDU88_004506 [Pleurodeles waltl]|uniref:Uncharacterized protein n=1 Tax=Pleurodeles waltl TaxID=8319 RepID=A0AAV7M6I0_PLEWA|nr:hypothetical protein NDU88_004506 [Pleurodeles waltl]